MSLVETISADSMLARKALIKDKSFENQTKSSLLTTLIAEIKRIGFDDGKRQTTDDEALKVVQKFVKGLNEVISIAPGSVNALQAEFELSILKQYLPQMASEDDILKAILAGKESGNTDIGSLMKYLKGVFGSTLDSKMANQLIKQSL